MTLAVVRRTLASLHEDPSNARKHDARNLEAITASLRSFGQVEPLVVQSATGMVIGGNGRLAAMRAMGWAECDVVELELDATQAARLGIALNRTGELASWDDETLAKLLQTIPAAELGMTGFDAKDLDALVAKLDVSGADLDDDEVPAAPENPTTKPGDLWILGDHRLLCGDSTSSSDVERVLGGRTPFIMVTDPPYGVSYDPEWRLETGLNSTDRTGKVANDDRVDWTAAYSLFPGAVAYVWHSDRFVGDIADNLQACGFDVRVQIIWVKPRFAISRGHYHWQHEPCWYAVRRGMASKWCGDRNKSTVWEIALRDDSGNTNHGTQKPIECMGRPISNHGTREDDVYEPFAGSGTTLIACERLHRRCCALEIDPGYVDVIVERWQRATGNEAILDGDGRTFAEIQSERLSSS